MSKTVYDISGADNAPNLPVDKIENERQTLIGLLVDDSSSMYSFSAVMQDCLEKFKRAIQGSKQEDEMLVALSKFGGNGVRMGGYQLINSMPTDYYTDGGTPLYDCIIQAQRDTYDGNGGGYHEELQQNGVKVKSVIAIFSDGDDTASQSNLGSARQAIELLRSKEIIVAFVAFGPNARGIANKLGIDDKNILETDANEHDLREVFNVISKSAISASKNAASGQSNQAFFV